MRSICSKAWVIDDDPTYQSYLLSFLNENGYSAQGFASGTESLKHIKDKPDLIILDHKLGNTDNTSVLKRINQVKAQIPVIYISSQEKGCLLSEAMQNEAIESNSMSLTRLKLRIEKISKIQTLKRKRRIYRTLIYSCIGVLWLVGIIFLLLNISI